MDRASRVASALLTEEQYQHSEKVRNLCKRFRDKLKADEEINWQLLKRSAWLHDVGKSENPDEHHKKESVRAALEGYNLKSDKEAVISVISCHKGKFEPDPGLELESAILRICDKMERFSQGKADAQEKCDKSMEKIKAVLKPETYQRFEQVYEDIRNDMLDYIARKANA